MSHKLTLAVVLRVLFGAMALIAVGTLAVPIYNDMGQLKESAQVVSVAEAGREVFTALQNQRVQRGPTRTALEAENPASDGFFSLIKDAQNKANPATAHVLVLCTQIDCTNGEPEVFNGLAASIEKLEKIRTESEEALKKPLSERRQGISKDFNAAATDVINRMEAMSAALGETIRMADPETAELMAIKQAAWIARDGVGLSRTALSESRNAKTITPAADRKMAQLLGQTQSNWGVVKELTSRPGVSPKLVELVKAAQTDAFDTWEKTRKAAYDDLAENKEQSVSNDDLTRIGNGALDALTAIPNTAMQLAQEQAESKYAAAQSRLMFQSGLLAAVVLLATASFFIVQRRVTRPITQMTDAMAALAAGDMNVEIKGASRSDEIGDMARAVEVFKRDAIERQRLEEEAERMKVQTEADKRRTLSELAQGFNAKVGDLISALVGASERLETTANDMTGTADRTSQQTGVLAESARATGSNVQAVAAATEELSSSANEIGTQVSQTADAARRAVEDVRHTDKTVQALSTSAERIETVVALINDIAARTNLLALNATIEAARAGEAGRGFAVVASEVKDLANQTIKATDEIASQIKELQQATVGAVSAIQSIGSTIERVHEISSAIAAAAEEQHSATTEIASRVAQAAQGTEYVTQSIDEVREAATITGSSASEVLSSARDLAKASTELRREMQTFISGIEAA
ncbi:methyl-accepting chemotaxis protein [Flaviflagellibacter deserti]|jgi:methyl-accepting chemotaxis protein|uniref:Methyl-accepting chemotaxis protein n=1 Tax=Flaviflagellibacter deserti TaxID=2267266 RepID=A0ABV9Z3A2_9HYPH